METRIIVCGIVCMNGHVLLGRKAAGRPPYPDLWNTPGGGVTDQAKGAALLRQKKFDDDYFHQELRREIKEEAGIDIIRIRNICPAFRPMPREDIAKNKHGVLTHYIFLEYLCDAVTPAITPGDDIAHVEWVERSKLGKLSLTPPSKQMYQELGWIRAHTPSSANRENQGQGPSS